MHETLMIAARFAEKTESGSFFLAFRAGCVMLKKAIFRLKLRILRGSCKKDGLK